ncbi:hypothetical protein [Glutamicibacter sp. PS]|uniref:hypothetical protein n=1 Tax=Glutamicibacter sp. PS TaxID=3075634 RepID=UPI00284B2836|nr:hypothetical protein [Glutamicibacter sp. PS]MDR4533241.1 hypothetical protein [Glutamicibacter sp. PS]
MRLDEWLDVELNLALEKFSNDTLADKVGILNKVVAAQHATIKLMLKRMEVAGLTFPDMDIPE